MMLWKLLSLLDQKVFQPEVISLTNLGPMAERIRKLGIPVRALEMFPIGRLCHVAKEIFRELGK